MTVKTKTHLQIEKECYYCGSSKKPMFKLENVAKKFVIQFCSLGCLYYNMQEHLMDVYTMYCTKKDK